MKPVSFYPGPSKVYAQVADYLQDAFTEGVLSLNHRSTAFSTILEETVALVHQKLGVPQGYGIYLVSSATEVWEIVAQSFTQHQSTHFYNGAFGKKWFYYASKIVPQASASWFDLQIPLTESLFENEPKITQHNNEKLAKAEVVCLTHNETSNGTQLTINDLEIIRQKTDGLIAIDATSSLGGLDFDWSLGDIWFASAQKCLGLPAGLGVMICSPKAIARAEQLGERQHYNSFLNIHENFQKYQTHYTPNVLGIYLLMRILQQIPNIKTIDQTTQKRASDWYNFFETETDFKLLVKNPVVRSQTVVAVEAEQEKVDFIKKEAAKANITIGNGYGEWKPTTFRIANFPAIEEFEIELLKDFFRLPQRG